MKGGMRIVLESSDMYMLGCRGGVSNDWGKEVMMKLTRSFTAFVLLDNLPYSNSIR